MRAAYGKELTVTTSILILETDDVIRESLREWLQAVVPGWRIIEAGSTEEAIAVAQAEWPRIILVDIADPYEDGVEIVREIKGAAPWAAVVALAVYDDEGYRDDLAAAGASASVLIWRIRSDLVSALKEALANEDSSGSASHGRNARRPQKRRVMAVEARETLAYS